MIAANNQVNNPESFDTKTIFGAAVLVIFVFLVFFLYINQKWCFTDFRNIPFFCCDEVIVKTTTGRRSENSFIPQQNIHRQNLISLAEKGKVGTGSCPSSSCSTTSGEEEPTKEKALLRHRDSRGSAGSHNCRKLAKEVLIDTKNEGIISQHCDLAPPVDANVMQMEGNHNLTQPEGNPRQYLKTSPSMRHPHPRSESDVFDMRELRREFENEENALGSTCGTLEVAFAYEAPMRKMTIHVLQARNIPSKERGGATHTQVRLLMLPSKKQKHKSKIRSGENPQFMESFLLHRINPEDVNSLGVRFRLYGCERMRREKLIGECAVGFASLNLELETTMWLILEPRANLTLNSSIPDLRSLARSDNTSPTHSMQHGGVSELLLGLSYNGTTGRLSVEIVKGSHFSLCGVYRNLTIPRISDTYVKLSLISSTGREISRCKTSIRRGQPNPLFKELFMFQVPLFQISDVTLLVSVYMKRNIKRKEMVGWFSLGFNSSGEEELSHWNDMREAKGKQICRWHILIDS